MCPEKTAPFRARMLLCSAALAVLLCTDEWGNERRIPHLPKVLQPSLCSFTETFVATTDIVLEGVPGMLTSRVFRIVGEVEGLPRLNVSASGRPESESRFHSLNCLRRWGHLRAGMPLRTRNTGQF